MKSAMRTFLLLIVTTSCGFPRPAHIGDDDVPGDSGGSSDGGDAPDPTTTVHVSPSGDDGNDGVMLPVKTLKHAIGIAAADTKFTHIVLASGSYSMATGETFPYTVPRNVTIAGPAGGGAILAGSKAGPGMTVEDGGLQDLDLQDFTTAIFATGMANLKNIRVLTSKLAVQAETAAKVTIDNLDVAGTAGECATGIVLIGAAQLMATTIATRNLGVTLDAKDQSVTNIANANVLGDIACSVPLVSILIKVMSTASFVLSDSLLDGGSNGMLVVPQSSSFRATISNTIVRNMKGGALGGFPSVPGSFQMLGGELSNAGAGAVGFGLGTWTFTGVKIRQNKGPAFYVQEGKLVMRDCVVTNNSDGINLSTGTADLGTAASPGNNIFQGNTGVGLSADTCGGTLVEAIGNIWNAGVQGADQVTGKYATVETIPGPVARGNGNNFSLVNGCSLSR